MKNLDSPYEHHKSHEWQYGKNIDQRDLKYDCFLVGDDLQMGYFKAVIHHHCGKNKGRKIAEECQGDLEAGRQLNRGVDFYHGTPFDGGAASDEGGVNDHFPHQLFGPSQGIVETVAQQNIKKKSHQSDDH